MSEIVGMRAKLAPFRSKSEAFLFGGLAGVAGGFVCCAALLVTPDSFSMVASVGIVAFAAVSTVAGLVCLATAFKREATISEEWRNFWAGRHLFTPAGERVSCIGGNRQGSELTVRFLDGAMRRMPLSMLVGEDGRGFPATEDMIGDNDRLFARMAKVRWKTSDGRVGVVRGAATRYEADTELTLKLEDGTVAEFKISTLEPVPA
jgi:hypothetical protein